jgi:hypothetical protein
MKTLVKTIYGSKLFGTALPASDTDFKSVFVCDMEELVFGKTATQNTVEGVGSQKVESEAHHISHFCRMLKQGQTLAYSMLFTPDHAVVETSDAWKELVENKSRLVSKNLRPFVGYARSQAQKYSLNTLLKTSKCPWTKKKSHERGGSTNPLSVASRSTIRILRGLVSGLSTRSTWMFGTSRSVVNPLVRPLR